MRIIGSDFLARNFAGLLDRHPDVAVYAAGPSAGATIDPDAFARDAERLNAIAAKCRVDGSRLVVLSTSSGGLYGRQDRALLESGPVPVDEIVVVDDCSEDDTAARARRWTSILPLKVLSTHQRAGIWASRHAGLAELTTDLVMQLDADDMLAPHHVEAMRDA